MDTSVELCKLIVEKHLDGVSQRRIAREVNKPLSTVSSIILRYQRRGRAAPNRSNCGGKNKKLTVRTERALVHESKRHVKATARQIRTAVGGEALNVHLSTIKRRLVAAGRKTYRPTKSPKLSPKHMKARLKWAKTHEDWTKEMWAKVSAIQPYSFTQITQSPRFVF